MTKQAAKQMTAQVYEAAVSFKFEFHLVFRRWMPITNS
jgi:hypothetical protein